jgi:hypothetical protein
MNANEIFEVILSGIRELVGRELTYLSSNDKKTKIISIDDSHVNVTRNDDNLQISLSRFRALAEGLKSGMPVHIDTLFNGGGNDRAIIETIAVHLPNVGYMKGNSGRNKNRNKVFQWFATPQHALGEILDVSDEKFSILLSTSILLNHVKLSKSFLLLAGISGTGKSRFVRKQAENSGSIDKNYKLISVRPDWHEPSDLLGYISRIKEEKYIVTDALKFMVSAWCDACDLVNTSEKVLANKAPSEMNTFWLCLDEMNLAPVEQYFADYLSVIETRKWNGDSYSCDAILKADVIKLLEPTAADNLRKDLGLSDPKYLPLWSYFSEIGIPLPPNLIVAGTVNMDETTHGFSRKVIDRALTLDFGQFFPNDFDAFFEPTSNPVIFSFPTLSQATKSDFNDVTADSEGKNSLEFLKGINEILKGTMFELAYRALNELFISVICIKPKNEIELQAVWDDFLMAKVLPRIEGDDDKLRSHNDPNNKEILKALDEYIKQKLPLIYETELRPDFFRIDATSNKPVEIKCRSRAKLKWMSDRLANNGFTTFWP